MEAFNRFVLDRESDLRRIARHTRGECAYDDVINEAWLMAERLKQRTPADISDPAFQQLLLSHLYQHLVRYTELNIRRAVRLDHAPDDTESGSSHPLQRKLAAHDDPLAFLIRSNEKPFTSQANEHHSLAGVHLILLRHFGHGMRRVARHLLISLSQAYRRFAKARRVTAHQHALLLMPAATMDALKPWRRQRTRRPPRQFEFDFEERLPFAPEPPPAESKLRQAPCSSADLQRQRAAAHLRPPADSLRPGPAAAPASPPPAAAPAASAIRPSRTCFARSRSRP